MYDIFIKNFYENGALITGERRLYSIPISQEDREYVLTDPTVTCDTGKTGSFEFTIYPNHPYYHAIAQMRTIMRVKYDGDTIFRGRILTVDNTLTGAKKIHCEGDMAFLLDSFQMGSKKEERTETSLNSYINQVLGNHNSQMSENGETDKLIFPGYIPGNYPSWFSSDQIIENAVGKFGSNSHEQSMNALETLTKEYGGFIRTRYNEEDGKVYLDWCRNWFRADLDTNQPIAITQNIIDAQSSSEVNNIFTAVIPVGSKEGKDVFIKGYRTDIHGDNNRILVPQIQYVFSDEELDTGYVNKSIFQKAIDQYGIIYKVQNFSNADTQEKLWNYACDWIRHNYVGGITNYDLTAVDMHHLNGVVQKYLVGDYIPLMLPPDLTELDEYSPGYSTTIYRTILSVKYNLHNPEKNSYTAGIASDILNLEYGVSSSSKSKGGKGGAGAKGGGAGNNTKTIGGDSSLTEKSLKELAWNYVISSEFNNDLYEELKANDPTGERVAAAEKATHARLIRNIKAVETLEDGSTEEKFYGVASTLILDAAKGTLDVLNPVINFLGFDELGNKITELRTVKSMEINGYNGYLSMKNVPTYHDVVDPVVDPFIKPLSPFVDIVGNVAGNLLDPFNVFDLRSKSKGANMLFTGGTADNKKTTASTDGEKGWIGEIVNVIGSDGSGMLDVATIIQNGIGNNGKGSEAVGKDALGNWLIHLNEPLQYSDSEGVHTIPDGVVDATDYSTLQSGLERIPSFVTQIGVFKTLIANNIQAIDLKADKADFNTLSAKVAAIDKITSGAVVANRLHVKNMDIDGTLRLKSMTWGNNNTIKLIPFSSLGMGNYVLGV